MPAWLDEDNRDRMTSALGVAIFHALIGYAFIAGLGFDVVATVRDELKTFDVTETLPPPPEVVLPPAEKGQSQKRQTPDPEGAASPANLRDTPSPIVAPVPEIRLPIPPPVTAAPVAGQGNADAAGAADVPGPGTGRGGIGTGLGSGRHGMGTGGGGGGEETPPRWIRGRIRNSDYPRAAADAGIGGTVSVRYAVAPSGRVTDCDVTRSSGSAELDATTCRLIIQRFRFEPSRNAAGRPILSFIAENHTWVIEQEAPERR